MWKQNKIAIDVVYTSKYCILLKVNPRSLNPWILSVVYGSPQERHREDLWNELRSTHGNFAMPWCVVGDFNSVLHPHEKVGGGDFNIRACQRFAHCIFDCNLLDLGYKGPLFTWRSGNLKERLDRALCDSQWQALFLTVLLLIFLSCPQITAMCGLSLTGNIRGMTTAISSF